MTHNSTPKSLAPLLCVLLAGFAFAGTPTASKLAHASPAPLDQLIPQDKWTETGLNKLTSTEQQTLAGEITALLGAKQSADSQDATDSQSAAAVAKDRTQWRKLQRRMSKDDVKKLLGEPFRVSVSRFYESWDYAGGTVTFNSKGRLDFWGES